MNVERSEIFELITAYVDDEITDNNQVAHLKNLIENNPVAQQEFLIATTLKSVLSSRFSNLESPGYLKRRVQERIQMELSRIKDPKPDNFRPRKEFFQFKYAFVAALILLGVFFLFNPFDKNEKKIAEEQTGRNNMFIQAQQNFDAIKQGKLSLQIASGNFQTIRDFFKQKGVRFQPVLPVFKNYNMAGAIVSANKGEILPHNIYINNNGKLVYLYQANEECLKKKKILTLSDDLINMVDKGKYYIYSSGKKTVMAWKSGGNICLLVSNEIIDDMKLTLE